MSGRIPADIENASRATVIARLASVSADIEHILSEFDRLEIAAPILRQQQRKIRRPKLIATLRAELHSLQLTRASLHATLIKRRGDSIAHSAAKPKTLKRPRRMPKPRKRDSNMAAQEFRFWVSLILSQARSGGPRMSQKEALLRAANVMVNRGFTGFAVRDLEILRANYLREVRRVRSQ